MTIETDQISNDAVAIKKLDDLTSQIADFKSEFDDRLKTVEKLSDNFRIDIADKLSEINALKAERDDLLQKLDSYKEKDSKEADVCHKSIGVVFDEYLKSQNVKFTSKDDKLHLRVKATTLTTANTPIAGTTTDRRIESIYGDYYENLLDFIPVFELQEGHDSHRFVRQTKASNEAAVVPEGTQKPQGDIATAEVFSRLKTIAETVDSSTQLLKFGGQELIDFLDNDLSFAVRSKTERSALWDDGDATTGNKLCGIMPIVPQYNQGDALTSNMTAIDYLMGAELQINLNALSRSTLIVLNPVDFVKIKLAKTDDGAYLYSNPASADSLKTIWGTRVLATPAMTAGNYLVGDFVRGVKRIVPYNSELEIRASFENNDNFSKNIVTFRAEWMTEIEVRRLFSFVKGIFASS